MSPLAQPAGMVRSAARSGHGCVAVVHPYSSGRLAERAFRALGWRVIAVVQACPLPVQHAETFDGSRYDDLIADDQDPGFLAGRLRDAGVTAVVPGCETGVALAEALAARLGLGGNDPATTASRLDKQQMVVALDAAGVRCPATLSARSLPEAFAAVAGLGGFPVVFKPAASSASEGVRITRNAQIAEAAWKAAAGRSNLLGGVNDGLLVQEYLAGAALPPPPRDGYGAAGVPGHAAWQYTVNTVTSTPCGGPVTHWVTDAWLDRRRELDDGYPVYDLQVLLDGSEPAVSLLGAYAADVLNALGVTTGAGHLEIALVGDGTGRLVPVLIEAAARFGGMIAPRALRAAVGHTQVAVLAEALTDPGGFARRARHPYQRRAAAAQLDLLAPGPAALDPDALAEILRLPTVKAATAGLRPGARVTRTTGLQSSPGKLDLVGDPVQVDADCAAVRAIEAARLYRALP